jgi:hypothetical protein
LSRFLQEQQCKKRAKPSLRSGTDLKVKRMLGGRYRADIRKVQSMNTACETITITQIENEIDKAHENVNSFIEKNKNANTNLSSYEDWNYKDIIAHITEWIRFSADKLESIKNGKVFKDIDDFSKVNQVWFVNDKDKDMKTVILEFENAISQYNGVLKLYTKEDLIRTDYPTGFEFELWRYMIMDGSIHPNKHLLYYYLKKRDYESFIKILEQTKSIFALYSKNNIEVYSFEEYEDVSGMIKESIRELGKLYSNNEVVKKVIEANKE